MSDARRHAEGGVAVGPGPLTFDDAAADALAVMTLLVSGRPEDAALASQLLDVLAAPGHERRLINGMSTICASLLALLEFYGHLRPPEVLRELGRAVARANSA